MAQLNDIPLKTEGDSWVRVSDIGKAEEIRTPLSVQYRSRRRAKILLHPDSETRWRYEHDSGRGWSTQAAGASLRHPEADEKADLLFDQSVFVKEAINTVLDESLIGLALTSLMILLFLGNFRATTAVLLSIPVSILATFVKLKNGNATIKTMILGGTGAGAFARNR